MNLACGKNLFLGEEFCVGRFDYVRELYLATSTTMTCLSAWPAQPSPREPTRETQILPTSDANATCELVNKLARSQRAVMHAYVIPNRSRNGSLQSELERMTQVAEELGDNLGGWKLYPPFGDIAEYDGFDANGQPIPFIPDPFNPGYRLDSEVGRATIEHALQLHRPVVCAHKGLVLGTMQDPMAACIDVGIVGRDYPDARLMIYHSGYFSGPVPADAQIIANGGFFLVMRAPGTSDMLSFDGGLTAIEGMGPYPGDSQIDSSRNPAGTNALIKSLRENGWSARHFAPGGSPGVAGAAGEGDPGVHANNPNVFAELGSTWNTVGIAFAAAGPVFAQSAAAHLLGKLIYQVGPRRVVYGSDSIATGNSQQQIIRLREFPRPDETIARDILAELYHLPYGLEGDVRDPTQLARAPEHSIRNGILGRNSAAAYRIDVDQRRKLIDCGRLQQMRDAGLVRAGTEKETRLAATTIPGGYRTRRQLFQALVRGHAG